MWPCKRIILFIALIGSLADMICISYRFKLPTPNGILGLPIGQHVSIGAACLQPDGTTKEVVRSYTPISGDHEPGYFDLLVKTYPQGNISQHVASLKIGQSIRIRGPKGSFVYTPNMVRHFGMVAGGTGITLMLQIVRAIVRGRVSGDTTEVDLIFANVTPQDILLKDDIDAIIKEDSRIRVHYVLDKPPKDWTGGVGYVTGDMITVSYPQYLCSSVVKENYRSKESMLMGLPRNGCRNLPMMSRSSAVALRPWWGALRRQPRLSGLRRLVLSASSTTRSLLSKAGQVSEHLT